MNFKELGAILGLEEDEYRELVELFMTTGSADFQKLIDAVAAGDSDTAMRSAHTIKGASGNLGLTDVYEVASLIEERANNKQLDDLAQAIETMKSQFDAIQTFIE